MMKANKLSKDESGAEASDAIIVLALLLGFALVFMYVGIPNILDWVGKTREDIEDIIVTNIEKDQIIEARISKSGAKSISKSIEKIAGVKYISLESETIGKVLSVIPSDNWISAELIFPGGNVISGFQKTTIVVIQELTTDTHVCFDLDDSAKLQRKGETIKVEEVKIGSYIKIIPI